MINWILGGLIIGFTVYVVARMLMKAYKGESACNCQDCSKNDHKCHCQN